MAAGVRGHVLFKICWPVQHPGETLTSGRHLDMVIVVGSTDTDS